MLAKINRFHGHGSLNYVYKHGSTIRSPYCAIRFIKGKYPNYRVAVVVSKKVAKSAPDRNRIRRRLYEAIRVLAPKYITNQDMVLTVFDNRLLTIESSELIATIERQLQEITDKT